MYDTTDASIVSFQAVCDDYQKKCIEVKEKLESGNIKSCTLKHDYEGHQCYSILLVRTSFVTEPKAKLYRYYP